MGEKTACPECGNEYKKLGTHWSMGSCSPPELTERQKEIVVGLLMGDGYLKRSNKNPYVRVKMISPNYLKYLDGVFGSLSTGVQLHKSAAELAKRNRDSGFRPNAKKENYSEQYIWKTRSLPELHEFNWYKTGKKVWPEWIPMTATVLKHWYVGDGHFSNKNGHKNISIGMSNEVENTDKIDSYFERMNLPTPSNYNIQKRKNGRKDCSAYFTRSASEELWEYMGEPLPDFEYKWPEEYRNP
jgi:hypothetical protein